MQFPDRSVLICANQRSGSTMLSSALAATGVAGDPQEYFLSVDEKAIPDFATWETGPFAEPPMTRSDYLAGVYRQGTTPNSVFAAKLMWNCYPWMLQKFAEIPAFAGLSNHDILRQAFGSFDAVLLTRRDRLAQAVSWAIADQENQWVIYNDGTVPHPGPPRPGVPDRSELSYDAELIGNLQRLIRWGESGWRNLLDELGVEPIEVVYEDMVDDLAATVSEIAEQLELGPIDTTAVTPRTVRQADGVNQAWVERFRAEHPDLADPTEES